MYLNAVMTRRPVGSPSWSNAFFPSWWWWRWCSMSSSSSSSRRRRWWRAGSFQVDPNLQLSIRPSRKTNLFYAWTGVHLTQYLYRCFFSGGFRREICSSRNILPKGHEAKLGGDARSFSPCPCVFYSAPLCLIVLWVCVCVLQEDVSLSALVQLFDPLLSPRCYAVVGLKRRDNAAASWRTHTCTHRGGGGDTWSAIMLLQPVVLCLYLFLLDLIICMISSQLCNLFQQALHRFQQHLVSFYLFAMKNESLTTFSLLGPRPCAPLLHEVKTHLEKLSAPFDWIISTAAFCLYAAVTHEETLVF